MKNILIILSVIIFSAIFTVNAGSQGMGMMHGKDHGAMWSANMQNMDTSRDGKISKDEWNKYYDNIFTRIDMNKNGFIDDKEIQAYHRSMTGSMMNGGNREMMGKSYVAKMDTNRDGKISRDEWSRYHREKFKKADTNRDGFIDKNEMQAYHQSMIKD